MSTPKENLEIAADESNEREAREEAIGWLEAANECDMLAELVQMDDLEEHIREQALTSLAHPQCKPTLETLADSEALPASLEEQASSLLQDTPDDSGAGP